MPGFSHLSQSSTLEKGQADHVRSILRCGQNDLTDGSPDSMCIRIWWEADGIENDVYDNGVEQAIGGGNIVVHTK